jgi:serine/threonine protein phosphatase PrpC
MGTTLSVLLVVGNQGFIAHVGDSRVYLARGGRIQQVTEDHTVYNELIKRGKLTREQIEKVQQKNAITRAVGVYERVEVDTLVIELTAGDVIVLASDGLHGYLESPEELRGALSLEGDAIVEALIALANDRGGKDNITTIVVKLGEEGAVDAARARRLALKRDVLANMPLFSRLTERELLRVMQAVEVRQYKDGDAVIREGDKGDELFIVLEGIDSSRTRRACR